MGQDEGLLSASFPSAADSPRISLLQPSAGAWRTERQLEPRPEEAPAWLLALWGVAPYAEIQAAGLPMPPSPAEVAELPASTRMQEQAALKSVWMERLIRAREERNRVSRESLSRSVVLARKAGAPAAFVDLLRRQSAGMLPAQERYLLDSAQQTLLASYGVDAREMRFFVEASELSPEQLRDVAAWLPLPALFNAPAEGGQPPASPRELGANFVEYLAVRRDLGAVWQGVRDRESADAAADALLSALVRHVSAMRPLMAVPEEQRATALAPYAKFASVVNAASVRERARLQEHGWYGSHRLQALDYLLH